MKWAIQSKSGQLVTHYTVAFAGAAHGMVQNWDRVAVFLRKREAEAAIIAMHEKGYDTIGMKPVKVLQRLEVVK